MLADLDLQAMVDLVSDGGLGLLHGASASNGLMLEAGTTMRARRTPGGDPYERAIAQECLDRPSVIGEKTRTRG